MGNSLDTLFHAFRTARQVANKCFRDGAPDIKFADTVGEIALDQDDKTAGLYAPPRR